MSEETGNFSIETTEGKAIELNLDLDIEASGAYDPGKKEITIQFGRDYFDTRIEDVGLTWEFSGNNTPILIPSATKHTLVQRKGEEYCISNVSTSSLPSILSNLALFDKQWEVRKLYVEISGFKRIEIPYPKYNYDARVLLSGYDKRPYKIGETVNFELNTGSEAAVPFSAYKYLLVYEEDLDTSGIEDYAIRVKNGEAEIKNLKTGTIERGALLRFNNANTASWTVGLARPQLNKSYIMIGNNEGVSPNQFEWSGIVIISKNGLQDSDFINLTELREQAGVKLIQDKDMFMSQKPRIKIPGVSEEDRRWHKAVITIENFIISDWPSIPKAEIVKSGRQSRHYEKVRDLDVTINKQNNTYDISFAVPEGPDFYYLFFSTEFLGHAKWCDGLAGFIGRGDGRRNRLTHLVARGTVPYQVEQKYITDNVNLAEGFIIEIY
jgi:hypothetical protein